MSDKPVWLEEWGRSVRGQHGHVFKRGGGVVALVEIPMFGGSPVYEERLAILAAAPALVRALLLAEWADNDDEDCCPVCGELKPAHDRESTGGWTANGRPCALDAALTIAGFTDQASRDAAREMIRKEKGTP